LAGDKRLGEMMSGEQSSNGAIFFKKDLHLEDGGQIYRQLVDPTQPADRFVICLVQV
jgi:hypothetical protein